MRACVCVSVRACVCTCVCVSVSAREPAVNFLVYACAFESWPGEGRKNSLKQTSQDLVARAQDSEPTNQIAVTRKLHVNSFP